MNSPSVQPPFTMQPAKKLTPFKKVLIVVGILIGAAITIGGVLVVLIFGGLIFGISMLDRSSQQDLGYIQQHFDGAILGADFSFQEKSCDKGDPVDGSPTCDYEYKTNLSRQAAKNQIKEVLTNNGYKAIADYASSGLDDYAFYNKEQQLQIYVSMTPDSGENSNDDEGKPIDKLSLSIERRESE